MSRAELSLTSSGSASASVELQSEAATLAQRGEDWTIEEQHPPAPSGPMPASQVRVPDGWKVTVHLAEGALSVRTFRGTLQVDVDLGAVHVHGVQGVTRVNTSLADVSVDTIEGDVELRTGSGAIAAQRVRGPMLAVSDNGRISVSDYEGQLEVRTISGDIAVSDLSGGGARLTSRSGSVKVRAVGVALTVRTLTGDVDFDSPVVAHTRIETTRGILSVRVGAESSARIEASAPMGLVRTERLTLSGPPTRRAARAIVGAGLARLRVESARGVIELTGPPPDSS